jgi:hypothetical protein
MNLMHVIPLDIRNMQIYSMLFMKTNPQNVNLRQFV